MIYGATGYTGRLACDHAKSLGFDFVVAGRAETKTKGLASSLGVASRTFSLEDAEAIVLALKDIRVLLNCAGPFAHTAKPFIAACLRSGVHYLDTSAELDTYRLVEQWNDKAIHAKIMVMPGCGGSVAMLGCLVGSIVEYCSSPISVDVALHVAGSMSRGSAISAAESMATECYQLVDGRLKSQDVACTKRFDFGDGRGDLECFPTTLPELITIWKSTGIPNVRTFVHASDAAFSTGDIALLLDGPSAKERLANPYHVAAAVTSSDGTVVRAILHTMNGYTFTAIASVEAVRRVIDGVIRPGFQTPVDVFGHEFVVSIADSTIRRM